ncbi:MAG: lysophospholipid acyltransferase family protein [Deltaproteobacteria bacterium]|jgi:KDO2-lipid IV(A) lauroyltransferase|nr:lysophospholipid acyltransferase family protein [Deltaproteobacteria bacterium]
MDTDNPDILARNVSRYLGFVPLFLRKAFFYGLWRLFYYLSPRHRFIALHNLIRAFPDKSMAEIIRITKGAYRNLAIVCAEFFDLPKMNRSRLNDLLDIEGLERAQQALGKKKGLLLFGAHFSNWELMAAAASALIAPGVMIYRPLDNPFLERFVKYVRTSRGNVLVSKKKAMLQMFRCLAKNGVVGVLIDQNVSRREGVFADFFGRPACTTDGLAQMAIKSETPVMPAFIIRKPDGRYRLIIGKEVEIIRTGNSEDDIRTNTQRFTSIIEGVIRQYPDQWLWLHQRWKTKEHQVPSSESYKNNPDKQPEGDWQATRKK